MYTGSSHPAVFEMNDEVGLTLKDIKYEAVESHVWERGLAGLAWQGSNWGRHEGIVSTPRCVVWSVSGNDVWHR